MSNAAHPNNPPSRQGSAVITGASAGLGKIYADRLARRGHDLILIARRSDRLEEVAARLRNLHGVRVKTIVADLAMPADLDRVADLVASDKTITLLVNNAGASTVSPFGATEIQDVEAMNKINVQALVRLSHAVFPAFVARKRGTLINIGSVLGLFSLPGFAAYSATKGYVHNFTRALQDEAAGTGVTVQLVLPAATATDIWELSGVPLSALNPAHIMEPEACVDAALAGLDLGEAVTFPSLENLELFYAFEAARTALGAATQNGTAAQRYGIGI
jgi:short-subunit dehydrogenase